MLSKECGSTFPILVDTVAIVTGLVGYPSSNHPLVNLKKQQILERLRRSNTTWQKMDTDGEFVVVVLEKINSVSFNFHKSSIKKIAIFC